MQKNKLFTLVVACLLTFGCATDMPIKTVRDENRNSEVVTETEATTTPVPAATAPSEKKTDTAKTDSSVERKEDLTLSALDIQKFAYELGFDPKKDLKESEKTQILERKKLRQLERALDSQTERVQYSKVLPWLKDDGEKVELLSIPGVEGRQVWINKNKIWSRAKSLEEFDEIVESQDIALGMPTEYVKKSWGEPDHVEASGNPIYRNERWQYNKQIATPQGYKQERRLVYFEGGRVVGWETE